MPNYFSVSAEGAECSECCSRFVSNSLRCSECGIFVHLTCSKLPLHTLIRLATTRASFVCNSCIRLKAGEKWDEVLGEVKQLMASESTGSDSSSTVGDSQASDIEQNLNTAASAPPASQMPLTQETANVEAIGGDSWVASDDARPRAGSLGDTSSATRTVTGEGSGDARAKSRLKKKDALVGNVGRSCEPHREAKERNSKNGTCRYYRAGNCKFGQKGVGCKFLHPKKCFRFMRFGTDAQRGCKTGDCSFLHPPLCRLVEAGKPCTRDNCRFFHRRAARVEQTRKQIAERKRNFKEKQPPKSYREYTRQMGAESEAFDESVPRLAGPGADPMVVPSGIQLDFRLLKEQMVQMEQQIRQLLDVRNWDIRNQRCTCR